MFKQSLVFSTSVLFSINCYALTLTSQSIENNTLIKSDFICSMQHGGNQSPHMSWKDIPKNTQSFLLVAHDPDAKPKGYVHWLVYIDNPTTSQLQVNQKPSAKDDVVYALNDNHANNYFGPCPPKGTGVHHYNFVLYALNTRISKALAITMTLHDFKNQMQGHVIEHAKLTGLYINKD
jgi:Raf kinase inhibitor-like YbhB/YbcL family protein